MWIVIIGIIWCCGVNLQMSIIVQSFVYNNKIHLNENRKLLEKLVFYSVQDVCGANSESKPQNGPHNTAIAKKNSNRKTMLEYELKVGTVPQVDCLISFNIKY